METKNLKEKQTETGNDRKFANMLWEMKKSVVLYDPNEYLEYLHILKDDGFSKEDALIFINELFIIHKQPN